MNNSANCIIALLIYLYVVVKERTGTILPAMQPGKPFPKSLKSSGRRDWI